MPGESNLKHKYSVWERSWKGQCPERDCGEKRHKENQSPEPDRTGRKGQWLFSALRGHVFFPSELLWKLFQGQQKFGKVELAYMCNAIREKAVVSVILVLLLKTIRFLFQKLYANAHSCVCICAGLYIPVVSLCLEANWQFYLWVLCGLSLVPPWPPAHQILKS